MDTGKVVPSFSDHEFNHDVRGWLWDADCFWLLHLSTATLKLLRLSDNTEVISIDGLTSLDFDLFHSRGQELDFIDDTGLVESNSQLLWVHACCKPEIVWLPSKEKEC